MELSIMASFLRRRRNEKELRSMHQCAELCKKAGFNKIDVGGLDGCHIEEDDWENYAYALANSLSKLGVEADQAHAPSQYQKFASMAHYKEILRRVFKVSAILGVKYIVIHTDIYDKHYQDYNAEEALDMAYDFYAPYVEQAKKDGLGVAVENLFEYGIPKGERRRFSSTVEEQIAIIDRFNDPCVTACWDFGHGFVAYENDHISALEKLGARLSCTHVHDNYYKKDLHLPPYMGNIKWEEVMSYLKKNNYSGTFTYELVYGTIPDELIEMFLENLYKTGQYLLSL